MAWIDRTVVAPVKAVLAQGLTPRKLSLSVACGLAGGLFPVPGITTLVCIPIIYAAGANPVLAQGACAVTTCAWPPSLPLLNSPGCPAVIIVNAHGAAAVAVVVNFVATPLELAMIPTFAWAGALVLGALLGTDGSSGAAANVSAAALVAALQEDLWAGLQAFRTTLLCALVGWALFFPVCLVGVTLLLQPVFAALSARPHRD
jgi:hypothetical protein